MPRNQVGTLTANLDLDSRKFNREIDKADRKTKGFGKSIGALSATMAKLGPAAIAAAGGIGIGALTKAFTEAARKSADYGANLVETAAGIGIAASELDLLRRAFAANGASIGATDKALITFNRRLAKARQGMTELREFENLGLDPNQFQGTADALAAVIRELGNIEDSGTRAYTSFVLLGKGEQAWSQTLRDGADAFEAELARQRELGILTDENANTLKDLSQVYADIADEQRLASAKITAENAKIVADFERSKGGIKLFFQEIIGEIGSVIFWIGEMEQRWDAFLLRAVQAPFQATTIQDRQPFIGGGYREQERSRTAQQLLDAERRAYDQARAAHDEFKRSLEARAALTPVTPGLEDEITEATARTNVQLEIANNRIKARNELLMEQARQAAGLKTAYDDIGEAIRKSMVADQVAGIRTEEAGRRMRSFGTIAPFSSEDVETETDKAKEQLRKYAEFNDIFVRHRANMAWEEHLAKIAETAQTYNDLGRAGSSALSVLSDDLFGVNSKLSETEQLLVAITIQLAKIGLGKLAGDREGGFFDFLRGITGRQYGGPVYANQPYITGDGGVPELFVPRTDGRILPKLPTGGRGANVTFNTQVSMTQAQFDTYLYKRLPEIERILFPDRSFA